MYIAYWIPTKRYIDISVPNKRRIYSVNISDLEESSFIVNICLIFNGDKPIKIEIEDESGNLLGLIEIKKFFRNGILIGEIKGKRKALLESKALYHEIKEFYHNHEHHDKNEDTLLTPYIFYDENLLNDKHRLLNVIIEHYLRDFYTKFKNFKIKQEEDLKKLKDIEKNFFNFSEIVNPKTLFQTEKRRKLYLAINSNIDKIHTVFSRINGEKEYYEFLKNIYKKEILRTLRNANIEKIISDTDNFLEDIKSIKKAFNDVSERIKLKESNINFKISIISFLIGIVSIFISIGSIILTIFFS